MPPTRDDDIAALCEEAHALCIAHHAVIETADTHATTPVVHITLSNGGTLPEYFDAQRQPLTIVRGGPIPRVHATWRGCLITWPALGYPLET